MDKQDRVEKERPTIAWNTAARPWRARRGSCVMLGQRAVRDQGEDHNLYVPPQPRPVDRLLRRWQYRLAAVIITILLLILYVPYVLKGGFIYDDWIIWFTAYSSQTFWQNLHHWLTGLAAMRPVFALLITVTSRIFRDQPAAYILLNISLWIGAMLTIARIVQIYLGKTTGVFFLLFALVPIIASTALFAPVSMIGIPAGVWLWAVSLHCLERFLNGSQTRYYVLTYVVMIFGLLCYELIFPLFLITLFLPMLRDLRHHATWSWRWGVWSLIRFGAPIIAVCVTVAVFQNVMVPRYAAGVSGKLAMQPVQWGWVKHLLLLWGNVLSRDLIALIFRSAKQIGATLFTRVDIWIVGILLLGVAFIFRKAKAAPNNRVERECPTASEYGFLVLTIITLCSTLLLFVLSGGYYPCISGSLNRLMVPAALCLSIIMAWGCQRLCHTKLWGIVPGVIFLFWLTLFAQRDQYIRSWALQQRIIRDCLRSMHEAHISDPCVIIGNVPIYLDPNLNNEEVFAEPWYFGSALMIAANGCVTKSSAIRASTLSSWVRTKGDTIWIGGWSATVSENVWYYEYDQHAQRSRLIKITGMPYFQNLLEDIAVRKMN